MKTFTFERGGQSYDFTALPDMTDAEILALVPEYGGLKPEPIIWTAERMAKIFKATDVRMWAKEMKLKTTGKEIEVAQRLLDAGFVPKE